MGQFCEFVNCYKLSLTQTHHFSLNRTPPPQKDACSQLPKAEFTFGFPVVHSRVITKVDRL